MDRIITLKPIVGIVYMQVCAKGDANDEELLEFCNKDNPSGTRYGWTSIAHEGNKAPVQCGHYPDRMHFLAVC